MSYQEKNTMPSIMDALVPMVAEQTSVERSLRYYSRSLKERIIFQQVGGRPHGKSCRGSTAFLESENPDKDIYLFTSTHLAVA